MLKNLFAALLLAVVVPAGALGQSSQVELIGPKRVVAVGAFEASNIANQKNSQWDVGGGMAAMLTTSLTKSDRFIVIERAYLSHLLNEQELKVNNVVKAETGPKVGQMTGAQFFIYGAVTEFGTEDKGGGLSLGLSGIGGGFNPLGAALGTRNTQGAVAIDLRIVDTTSSQVVQAITVKEPISSTSVSLGVNYRGMDLGGDQFWSTPLGEATRTVIDRAVNEIIATAARQPWQGQVVAYDAGEVIINAGANSGVKQGDRFGIERIGQKLTDPSTGEVLAVRRKALGIVQVTTVEEKISSGRFVATAGDPPQRSDIVLLAP